MQRNTPNAMTRHTVLVALLIGFVVLSVLVIYPKSVFAQERAHPQEQEGLDLILEELLTDKNKTKIAIGLTYNTSTSDRVTGAFETIQTGTGAFVSVPTDLDASRRETDTLIASTTLRYGLTTRLEAFFRSSAIHTDNRVTNGITGQTTSLDSSRFLNIISGINYRLLDDQKYPGLIGFADVTLAENIASTGSDLVFAKSGTVGLTAYRVIDPIVLSATSGLRFALSRPVNGVEINPGDSMFLNPAIAFAVNNELTLTGGLSMRFERADEVRGVRQGSRQTRGDLEFGVSYAWDRKTTLRIDTRADAVGEGGLTVGINVTKKFGDTQYRFE